MQPRRKCYFLTAPNLRSRHEHERLAAVEAVLLQERLDLRGEVEDVVVAARRDVQPVRD
jgi:hypothetical protein